MAENVFTLLDVLASSVAMATPEVFWGAEFLQRQPPYTKNYRNNNVYLYQFRRTPSMPSLSPDCLALETWLRLFRINYQNVQCNPWYRSTNDQLPFVECNGVEYSPNCVIVKFLSRKNNLVQFQTLLQQDMAKKVESKAHQLMWYYYYYRYVVNGTKLLDENCIGQNSPTEPNMPLCATPLARMLFNENSVVDYGTADVCEISSKITDYVKDKILDKFNTKSADNFETNGRETLEWLANALREPYFFGKNPTYSDTFVFGVLSQILYGPYENPFRQIIISEFNKLVVFCDNIRKLVWPDWIQDND